jgi:hypothetical protein
MEGTMTDDSRERRMARFRHLGSVAHTMDPSQVLDAFRAITADTSPELLKAERIEAERQTEAERRKVAQLARQVALAALQRGRGRSSKRKS